MADLGVKLQGKRTVLKRKDSAVVVCTDVGMIDSSVVEHTQKHSPEVAMVSLDKLHCYSTILNRTETEGVDVDDLDLLQWDLEGMLSAVAMRSQALEKEINSLNYIDECSKEIIKESSSSFSSVKQTDTHSKLPKRIKEVSNKVSEEQDEIPAPANTSKIKKLNDMPYIELKSKQEEKQTDTHSKLPKRIKEVSSKVSEERDEIPAPANTSKIKKLNDMPNIESKQEEKLPQLTQRRCEPPNKFWSSMNPFCTDILYQDVKFLEELIEKNETNPDIRKIPPLGRHYSERWAEEELMNERCESHFEGRTKAKRTATSGESSMLLDKVQNSVCGPTAVPLTERCISALLEENIEVPQNESKDSCNFLGESKMCKSGFVCKEPDFLNLQERIFRALENEGILETSFEHSETGDEILQEIKNCQTEMEVISNFNVTNLKRLLKLSKSEVARQDLRRKLEMVDNEVFESYRILLAAKQKKLPLSKTLEERCWNSLKERNELKRQFDLLTDGD